VRSRALLLALLACAVAAAMLPGSASATMCSSPTISGSPRAGQTLTGVQPSCPLASFSWAWSRCNTNGGSGCVAVGSSQSYTLSAADVGKYMRLVRTASSAVPPDDVDTVFTPDKVRGPPTANYIFGPSPAKTGQAVTFNGSGSSDPDSQSLTYRWDFDGNGTTDASTTNPRIQHSFPARGTYTVKLRVTDTDSDSSPTVAHNVTVKAPPTASFVFSPSDPKAGDVVTFTSTSSDADGDGLSYGWDFNDDGHTDSTARQAQTSFATAGSHTVTLTVRSVDGTSTVFRSVDVAQGSSAGPGRTKLQLLRPFPVVAIGGFVTGRGVRLTLLRVKAPRGSKVMVRCRGHGCPRRVSRKRVGRKKRVLFASFRRRFRAGTVIGVYVWKKNRIGKYTRFGLRRNRPPTRRDRCLNPNKLRPMRCPHR
jgi:PKD repeat protein